jgi:hypothetical protein
MELDMQSMVQLCVMSPDTGLDLTPTMLASMLKWTAVLACRFDVGETVHSNMGSNDSINGLFPDAS